MPRNIKPRTTALHFKQKRTFLKRKEKEQRTDEVTSPSHSLTLNIPHHSQHSSADWRVLMKRRWSTKHVFKSPFLLNTNILSQSLLTNLLLTCSASAAVSKSVSINNH